MLAILLFGSIGYRVLTHFLQLRANAEAQARIDARGFQSSHLLELKVPLNLPYSTNWTEWQHHEGDIEIDGNHYRYVERKLENGYMFVRCLPNVEKASVLAARNRFALLVNSFNQHTDQKTKAPVYISNYLGDYDDSFHEWRMPVPASFEALCTLAFSQSPATGHSPVIYPPPEPVV